jgi:hypothetical protein
MRIGIWQQPSIALLRSVRKISSPQLWSLPTYQNPNKTQKFFVAGAKTRHRCTEPASNRPPMRELLKTFKKDGFTHTQVAREGDLAIYRRMKQIRDVTIEHLEVIIIRRHSGYMIAGKKIEAAETYPDSERWGDYGWTCQDMDAAWARFKKLRVEREERAMA